jgi:multicomponent Na+:H+ antiporter subunit B
MRVTVGLILLAVIGVGIGISLPAIPFGTPKTEVGDYYIENAREDTGATNVVTSVVVGYRAFDTLGEVTVLFVAALGLGVVLAGAGIKSGRSGVEPASLILSAGNVFLFPLILLFGAYIFTHGHLTPGGGFQGGAVVASAFLLVYLSSPGKRINERGASLTESVSGLVFIVIGLLGLTHGTHYFLANFLPKGALNTLFSAGIIPVIYCAIGLKVGAELAGVVDNLMEATE